MNPFNNYNSIVIIIIIDPQTTKHYRKNTRARTRTHLTALRGGATEFLCLEALRGPALQVSKG
jgi:hypothetical protein